MISNQCAYPAAWSAFSRRFVSNALKFAAVLILLGIVQPITTAQSFSAPTGYLVRENPNFAAAGDLDGDGLIDLVTPNALAKSVTVLFNQGAGAFPSNYVHITDFSPEPVAIGDFNGDGKPDLAVGNLQGGR